MNEEMPTMHRQALKHFLHVYSNLNKNNIQSIREIYTEDIYFVDPAHQINGLSSLLEYFQSLYLHLNSCHFVIEKHVLAGNIAFLQWQMHLSHPKLAKGKMRIIHGCSYLELKDGRVCFHRDYFDLGALLYEGLPLIGRLISAIKKKFGQ